MTPARWEALLTYACLVATGFVGALLVVGWWS